MASKFRFFQANFSATLLRSAAIAIALLVQAAPARAQVVTLICQSDRSQSEPYDVRATQGWGSSFTLRINYDQKIVDLLAPDGSVWFSAAARITESVVEWGSGEKQRFWGSLNRLSGQGAATFISERQQLLAMSGPCRRATQKF